MPVPGLNDEKLSPQHAPSAPRGDDKRRTPRSAFTFSPPSKTALKHIALIGNMPPQRCGIATFTDDTLIALKAHDPSLRIDLYALADPAAKHDDAQFTGSIGRQDRYAYEAAGRAINRSGVQSVWLQHEYGIFGGEDGEYVLSLLDALNVPLCVTLHTVLEEPSALQRRILERMIMQAERLIVMAEYGKLILQEQYGAPPSKVTVIPHGIPDRPYIKPSRAKKMLGMTDRKIVLTFGLLSHDKGIGHMISALPSIVERHPDALYIVVGATHPHLIEQEGEALRNQLMREVLDKQLEDHVLWINEFVSLDELTRYIQAADIYVTPYLNPMQVTSGTLAYATGLGKPVISTPYVHATELLPRSGGTLVPFRDHTALATHVSALLSDDLRRARAARQAYECGRTMTWDCYAEAAKNCLISASSSGKAHSATITSSHLAMLPDTRPTC